jgi:integrase
MAKVLTDAAVEKYRAGATRREIPDAKATGLHLVIQTSGTKSWALRFRRPDGKTAKLTLGPVDFSGIEQGGALIVGQPLTLAAARSLAANIHRERMMGRDVVADRAAEKQRQRAAIATRVANTFGTLARQFIEEHAKPHTRRWQDTARLLGFDYPVGGAGEAVKDGLVDRWADKPVSEIDGHDLYAVVNEARRRGVPGRERRRDGPSDTQGRAMAAALSKLFGWLLEHRHIVSNPAVGMYKPPAPAARQRVLNVKPDVRQADELRWFWVASEQVGEPVAALLRLLLLTGCRLSEIAEMRWDELSDNRATLHLAGERTKNRKPYNVHLPPLALAALATVPRIEGYPYVFSTNGITPVTVGSKIKARLDAAMLAAARRERGDAVTIAPWRLHDLRRSCATGMAAIGIAPHIIEACLNHISGAKASVAGVYNVEQYEPEKRAAWERWAAHVESIVAGNPTNGVPLTRKRRGGAS